MAAKKKVIPYDVSRVVLCWNESQDMSSNFFFRLKVENLREMVGGGGTLLVDTFLYQRFIYFTEFHESMSHVSGKQEKAELSIARVIFLGK